MSEISLSQRAYTEIKHRIVTLKLPPNSVVSEGDLRDELTVGRTPIREALQQLAREKLVVIVPRRGIFVSDIDITDLARLFEVRVPLEKLAIRTAAERGTAADWSLMERCLQSAQQANSSDQLIQVDAQCHQIIYDSADNKFLTDTLTNLYSLSLRLWHYALPGAKDMQSAVLEHEQMLHALRAADGELAAQQMETHIRTFQAEIETSMLKRMQIP